MAKYEIQVLQNEIINIQGEISEQLKTIKQTFVLGYDKNILTTTNVSITPLLLEYARYSLKKDQKENKLNDFKNRFLGIKEGLSDIYNTCKMQSAHADKLNIERMNSAPNCNLM